jgi:ribosomal protein S18 acetylase RimI-like enzyme
MNDILIQPLSHDLLDDYLSYFDHEAFVDNPHWASCYCQFYLTDHSQEDWEAKTAAENRQSAEERITSGKMSGYLARVDQKVAGWCHAAPKLSLPGLADEQEIMTPQDAQIGAIVCFNVAPSYRGRGIASSLLQAACDGFHAHGLSFAEAYPRTQATSPASNYHGPLQMYLQAGFKAYRKFSTYQMVRKAL